MNDSDMAESRPTNTEVQAPQATGPAPTPNAGEPETNALCRSPFRRFILRPLKWISWLLAAILLLAAASVAGIMLFLRSESGEHFATESLNSILETLPGGLSASIESFSGPVPGTFCVSGLHLKDRKGECFSAESAKISISWSALPKELLISEISLGKLALHRLPDMEPAEQDPPEPPKAPSSPGEILESIRKLWQGLPEWMPALRIARLSVDHASLSREAVGLQAVLSLCSSASFSKLGAGLKVSATREDVQAVPAELSLSLDPALNAGISLKTSDLGLLGMFIDEKKLRAPDALVALDVTGKPEKLSFTLDARTSTHPEGSNAPEILAGVRITGDAEPIPVLKVHADSTASLGPAAAVFLKQAGLNAGKAGLTASADISLNNGLHATTSISALLEQASWDQPALASLLGKKTTLDFSLDASMAESGALEAEIKRLSIASARLGMEISGKTVLAPDAFLKNSSADLSIKAGISDSGPGSSPVDGDVSLLCTIQGDLSKLSAKLSVKSSRLEASAVKTKDTELTLSLPSIDIPKLAETVPALLAGTTSAGRLGKADAGLAANSVPAPSPEGTQSIRKPVGNGLEVSGRLRKTLLQGTLSAASTVNNERLVLNTGWSMEQVPAALTGPDSLDLALDKLEFKLPGTTLLGSLSAIVPTEAQSPREGTLAARLGIPAIKIDSDLGLHVDDWKPVARITGIGISGSPLQTRLKMQSGASQNCTFDASLGALRVQSGQNALNIGKFSTSLLAKDIWGNPSAEMKTLLGSFSGAGLTLHDVAVSVQGNEKEMKAGISSKGDISADASAHWTPGKLSVSKLDVLAKPAMLGIKSETPVGIRLQKPLNVTYSDSSAALGSPLECQILPSGTVIAKGSFSPDSLKATLKLNDLVFEKYRTLLPGLPLGSVSLASELSGKPSSPTGNFKLFLQNVHMPDMQIPPADVSVDGRLAESKGRRSFNAIIGIPPETQKAFGLSRARIDISIPFTSPSEGFSMPDMKGPLSGSITFSGDIGKAWKLVPVADMQAAGSLDLQAGISGSPSAPVVSADLSLAKGAFAEISQGVELRDISLKASVKKLAPLAMKGEKMRIDLSATDGRKGSISVNGTVDPGSMNLSIDGLVKNLSPLHRQDVNILLSGDMKIRGKAASPVVTGTLSVDRGEVLLQQLPGGGITELEITDPAKEKQKEAPASPGRADLHIVIPNQFFVRGYGLDCEWKGDLHVSGAFNRPALTGNLEAVRGTLDILNKNFTLAEGKIRFDGGWPPSPNLGIVMEYEAADITADITVGGTASDPKLTLSSQPSLPQDEIISQILFGQSSGGLSHMQALQLASAAASLAGFGGPDVMGLGRKMLGVDVLKVNSDNDGEKSGKSNTSLEMGTYVRDNVYVGIEQGVGKENDTGAVVEIELMPRLDAQAKTSGSKTEFGLRWKKNY